MIYCYRKSDLQIVGVVPFNITPLDEIIINVIPNFGGKIEDYDYIETDEQYFHLELINGDIAVVKEEPIIEPQPPSELEQLSNYILDVDFRVAMLEMGL